MLELANKAFKVPIINTFNNLKEISHKKWRCVENKEKNEHK